MDAEGISASSAPAAARLLLAFPVMGGGAGHSSTGVQVHCINLPRAIFVCVSPAAAAATAPQSSGGGGAMAGLVAAGAGSLTNLVVATPPLRAAAGAAGISTSVLMLSAGHDGAALESLARKLCMRLDRMVLLSCDVGVDAALADDGAIAAAAASSGAAGQLPSAATVHAGVVRTLAELFA